MPDLSPDARAVIAGTHADPFRYLGRHDENGRTVVRAYLPDAARAVVIGEGGLETELPRIDSVGLFAVRCRRAMRLTGFARATARTRWNLRTRIDSGP